MKKILVAFPDEFIADMDDVAKKEHRTRSDLVRESVRKHLLEAKEREVRLNAPVQR